jgi:sulfide dehydrogenase cytochrome subunit
MRQSRNGGVLCAGFLAFSATVWAAPPSAAMLSFACGGCHGTNGASAGPAIPTLAGQSAAAFVEAMKAFKSGARPATVMGRLARAYTDADFAAMGDFFARQKFQSTGQSLDSAGIARGAALQEANCAHCHLDSGRTGKDDTPTMAGQWLDYLKIQMALYQSGQRKMPAKMAEKVRSLSADDLDALLDFYASIDQ